MHIGHDIPTQYQMTNNVTAYTVTETHEEKDLSLGVYITKDLKWVKCHQS